MGREIADALANDAIEFRIIYRLVPIRGLIGTHLSKNYNMTVLGIK
jgi:hypothetical protein